MKRTKRWLSVLLAVCLMVLMAVPAWADETDDVNAVRNGVLQVNLNWIDQSGKAHPIQGGSGFLINDQTLLTNQHVVEMDAETKAAASAAYGVDFVNDTKLEVRVQVVVQRDVVMDATVRASSTEMDVAVVELSEPIYDRKSVALGDSTSITETQKVYALGFPQFPELAQDVKYYTNSDVTVTDGIVAKKIQNNGTPFIQHSAKISNGNSGGPLVNAQGQVIGINTFGLSVEEGYYYAMEINDIKKLLNALGISYNEEAAVTEPEAPVEEPDNKSDAAEEAPQEPVPVALDTAKLEAAIKNAEEKDLSNKYTDESLTELDEKLDKAYEVVDDQNTSQELIDKAAEDLNKAVDGLEEKGGMGMMLWIIIAAAAAVVIVVIIVIVVASSNKKKAAQRRPQMPPQQPIPPRPTPQPAPQPRPMPVYTPTEGAGETSVLGEGRGETTVLGAGAQSAAYMIRKKNNERVTVSGPSFTIGKERSRVNYCISDNTSISRCHARIVRKGAQYFVTDMNSTNFTFVNGVKVMPGQEVPLKERDVVRFADEDFEFHAN